MRLSWAVPTSPPERSPGKPDRLETSTRPDPRARLRSVERPETKYVAVGESDVAYQVVGDGPRDVLWMYPLGSHVDLVWQIPPYAEAVDLLCAFSRVIILDRRGSGASGPAPDGAVPSWEVFTEDIAAVLDASQSQRAAIVATRETGQIAILYAGMHPERVSALVLLNTTARYLEADDYPIGETSAAVDAAVELLRTTWGTEDFVRIGIPSFRDDPEALRAAALVGRASATPRQAASLYDYFLRHGDVRQILQSIQLPTLVLHVQNNPLLPIAHGRYLAEHIPGARFIELPGADIGGVPAGGIADIAEFLTGERSLGEIDRILTTVLFTDIARSTEQLASVGDERWRRILDAHDRTVRQQIRRFRGQEINTTGDGFVATFDGPGRAILCAQAVVDATREIGVDLRVGLHTGECEVRGSDLAGLAVHIAARVSSVAQQGEILVSRTVADLVAGSGIEFEDRGEHELKGVPGSWKLFAVQG
jgi:class 3 adenylate cyclase/pimeloyl-ACP methyl ester carboxylesterase